MVDCPTHGCILCSFKDHCIEGNFSLASKSELIERIEELEITPSVSNQLFIRQIKNTIKAVYGEEL